MLAGHLRSVERLSWRPPDGFFWRPENRTPGSRFHILGPYKIKIVHVITVQFRRRRTGSRVLFSQTWGNFRLIDNLKVGRFLLLSSSRFLPLMFPLILFNKSRGSKHEGPAPTASFSPPPQKNKTKKTCARIAYRLQPTNAGSLSVRSFGCCPSSQTLRGYSFHTKTEQK